MYIYDVSKVTLTIGPYNCEGGGESDWVEFDEVDLGEVVSDVSGTMLISLSPVKGLTGMVTAIQNGRLHKIMELILQAQRTGAAFPPFRLYDRESGTAINSESIIILTIPALKFGKKAGEVSYKIALPGAALPGNRRVAQNVRI